MSWLAIIEVLTSVLQTAHLFRLACVIYRKKTEDETAMKELKHTLIPIFIHVVKLIILGLFPNIVLNLIHRVVGQLQEIIPNTPIV